MEEKKRRIKRPILYGMYAVVFTAVLAVLCVMNFKTANLENTKPADYDYVSRLFGDTSVPVVSTTNSIIRPYTDDSVKVLQDFYSKDASEEEQEKSIINYEQTYIQNTGTSYGGVDGGFDVISVLDGTVVSVSKNDLLGNIIEVKNSDKITTIYQSLSAVNVKENDTVKQGDVLGKSGESNLDTSLGNHLTFKIKVNGSYVNPEDYYNKNINEI